MKAPPEGPPLVDEGTHDHHVHATPELKKRCWCCTLERQHNQNRRDLEELRKDPLVERDAHGFARIRFKDASNKEWYIADTSLHYNEPGLLIGLVGGICPLLLSRCHMFALLPHFESFATSGSFAPLSLSDASQYQYAWKLQDAPDYNIHALGRCPHCQIVQPLPPPERQAVLLPKAQHKGWKEFRIRRDPAFEAKGGTNVLIQARARVSFRFELPSNLGEWVTIGAATSTLNAVKALEQFRNGRPVEIAN